MLKPSHCCTAKSSQLHRGMVQAAKEPFWGAQGLQAHSLGCSRGVLLSKSLWHQFLSHLCTTGCQQLPPKVPLQAQPYSDCTCNTWSFIPLNISLEKLIASCWKGLEEDFQRGKARDTKAHLLTMSCAVTRGDCVAPEVSPASWCTGER